MSEVTNLAWTISKDPKSTTGNPDLDQIHAGLDIKTNWGVNPPLSCTGCHR
jgi:hypothetical protein